MKPLLRKDLKPPQSLIHQFAKIRNLLAGQANGMTLDHSLGGQLIDLLFCKMYDEKTIPKNKVVKFQKLPKENTSTLIKRIQALFREIKETPEIGSLFDNKESISLNPVLVEKIVIMLQPLELTNAKRDVIGEAFQCFIGSSLRGNEGQFFTPRNVVELTCKIVNPKPGEILVDPACGTGGYLSQAIRFSDRSSDKLRVFGIDKDRFLARVAAIQTGLLKGNADSWAFCANSLEPSHSWPAALLNKIQPGMVDAIMTNPPFGAKIPVGGEIIRNYELGKVWKKHKIYQPLFNSSILEEWLPQNKFVAERPPQILFIELCLNLLKPGGRLGIVVPDGILGNESGGYIRKFIKKVSDVVAIVDLPLETFMPSTSTKTSLLFLKKKINESAQKNIFMAIAEKCGHDRRGKTLLKPDGEVDEDFNEIAKSFREWSKNNAPDF